MNQSQAPDEARPHVLVVEDEQDLAALVELNLQLAGYDVTTARNGRLALERLEVDRPDVVLLDVMMPEVDGWQVLRQIKGDPATEDIPVIMLTALSEERDLIQGHLQGAVRYVTKPFEVRSLLATITDALAPADEAAFQQRRQRTRDLLRRLAELDSGRTGQGPRVQFSRLEHLRRATPQGPRPSAVDPRLLEELTEQQRYVAQQLAQGVGARQIATELGVSRSNVYAVRKRVARRFGVEPDDVAEVTRRLLTG